MKTERIAAFTDGVVAIIITIMVPEPKVPESAEPRALLAAAPILDAYVLSYINVGFYWNNHHHLLQAAIISTGARCGPICSCCSG